MNPEGLMKLAPIPEGLMKLAPIPEGLMKLTPYQATLRVFYEVSPKVSQK